MQAETDRTQPELPCVWVSAGVLSYRPCDRDFDCEGCPLYLALRGGNTEAVAAASPAVPARGDDLVERYLAELGSECTLHLDRAYSPDGLWLAGEFGDEVSLGLDDYTLRLLYPVDDVVLPRVGVRLNRGAPCAWVNRRRLAITLHCPVAGEVVAVRTRPAVKPPRKGESASERWWFRIKPDEPVESATGVYRNEALLGWYLDRVRAVRDHLAAVAHGPEALAVGPALADGGQPARDLETVLGHGRFTALVGALFPMHI
jgi:glycine cleavage system H lipoate-binding protein